MAKPRSERFDEERPEVSEQEIVNAAKANRVVVSFGSFPVMTDPTHCDGPGCLDSFRGGTS